MELVDLIDEHPGALTFDFRHRFGSSLAGALTNPDWCELVHLVRELTRRPDTHLAAAVNGWEHPWTWEAWILANIFDQWSDRSAPPYPRPNDHTRTRVAAGVDQRHVISALAARGHRRTAA